MNKSAYQKLFFIVLALAIIFGVLLVLCGQRLADQKKQLDLSANNLHVAQTESAISDDMVQRLQAELAQEQQPAESPAATTTAESVFPAVSSLVEYFALSPGKALLQEGQAFSIVAYDSMVRETGRTPVGTFAPPSQLDYERLSNGLYRLHGVADFTEAGYDWYLYVNEKTAKGLVIAGGSGNNIFSGDGNHIVFPDGKAGDLMVHIKSEACDKSHSELIDGMTWNGKTVLTFSPPLKVACENYEMGGGETYFFKGQEQVAQDLQSVTFPLVNGKSLVVKPSADGVSVGLH